MRTPSRSRSQTSHRATALRRWSLCCSAALAMTLGACSSGSGGDTGTVVVFAEPEDTIPDGLEPGTGEENIADGWTVKYTTFTLVIGNLRAHRSANPSDTLSDPKLTMLNMLKVPSGGLVLSTFKDVAATRWDKFGFDLANASEAVVRDTSVDQAEYDAMVAAGASLHVAGVMTKSDGQSCLPTAPKDCKPAKEVKFDWMIAAGTAFDDCAPPAGDTGFAVPAGGTVQVKPTIHGDHWFFSNITQGAELTTRRAQWIANADLDRDGTTTLKELAASKAADLFPASEYNLSGALIPIHTGKDYFEAQARTLGDFQGDGECPTRKAL